MKRYFLLSSILCLMLCFGVAVPAAYADSTTVSYETGEISTEYTISEPYEYVVKPNTAEWIKLTSTEEKVKATQIPEEILSKMTTKALVETVLKYPLLPNMYAFNTQQQGFDAVLSSFNGLQELLKRSDASLEIQQYQNKLSIFKTTDSVSIAQGVYTETLLEGINSKKLINSVVTPFAVISSVKTPKGTSVETYKGLTWSDHGLTASEASALQTQMVAAYPNTTVLSSQSPSYNCHSYAWYSQSSSNAHWMNSASSYRTDGSYTSGIARVGSKIDYGAGDHSGIVTFIGQGGTGQDIDVKSKWGIYGVFSHNFADCPYTMGNYSCTFWN
ncbi:hypothetical protein DFP94_106113 [Fontibacillus phaseoli]|uniref:Amidase domain-containing protein n=2 Tax=Fontibacillus phaseoli TaxID=1416533 RepID=A0A369BAM2_9BACL|nr:hypothetical protein DFP94_106113 [Fontibacillus phaseoli]